MQEPAERSRADSTADRQTADAGTQAPDSDFVVRAPSISLPKGGGAIRGIGEKFAANPVTGTASLSVPIYASPGRSGFGPQLSLSYDSGAGNGPFGFGWNLSLPSVTRKTDKGLPKYQDASESDVFILSGAEDLVPVLNDNGSRYEDNTTAAGYKIHRYRPRIEGLFARIERWTRVSNGAIHWRSISRDNVTTWYGKTADSRIADPEDPALHVFSWLICESYDDKGNAIVYDYVVEDDGKVDRSQANERNRSRTANRYLKRIKYGNRTPNRDNDWAPTDPTALVDEGWMFEVVFDYDDGHYEQLPVDPEGRRFVRATKDPVATWPVRPDPFSSYRAGFEVRTYRLCRRVLMFHHFLKELEVADYLVRSTEFAYEEGAIASFITSATQSGFVRQDNGTYLKKSLPPLEFEYSKAEINKTVKNVDSESLENLPIGLDGSIYQWVDLDGEGLSGILTEQAGGWYYKRNLSPLPARDGGGQGSTAARFAPLETIATKPSLAESGGRHRFLDLAGDGRQDVVFLERPVSGFYERTQDEKWEPFRNFLSCPNVDWADPNLRFVDLNGDGHADILITEHEAFTWYPSEAEAGFGPAEKALQALDEEKGPKLVFADGTQSIYLTDFSGDGLTDLARIRNGEVCYWPNLGYGRFGPKVTMDNSPRFDHPDQFSQQRIRLADIDGSGTTDILYLGRDRIDIYRNESGNRWAGPESLTNFPHVDNLSSVMAVDLLGNGTACLVWSSPLPGDAGRQMRYIDLMGGQKPHLMVGTVNNLGAKTSITYASSTKFYLADKRDGRPWITRIPFPVHVVERVETNDHISGNRFVTRYEYHHGYFDGVEREFRGFGMVEQWDTEEFASLRENGESPDPTNILEASHVPPALTRTWFHTGNYLRRRGISLHFEGEYFRDDPDAVLLPDTVLPAEELTVAEEREACRALKGSMLRQEIYARDGTDEEELPYTVTEQNFTIKVLQPRGDNRHAVFFAHAREAINYHYERNPADPRISHALTLAVDEYGNVRKALAIGYGRRQSPLAEQRDRDKQTKTLITYTENSLTHPVDDAIQHPDDYRTPLPAETRTYELTGFNPENNAARFSFDEWWQNGFALLASAVEIPYEQTADDIARQRRLIEQVRTRYRKDDLTVLLPLHVVGPLAIPGESYKLALTPGLLAHVFKRRQTGQPDEDLLPDPTAPLLEGKGNDQGGYNAIDGNWWVPSGRTFFDPVADVANPANTAAQELDTARKHFYLPRKVADPFGHSTVVDYDGPADPNAPRYDLLITRTRDALENTVASVNNYRVLQPRLVTDPNRNRTAAAFDALGMVVATAVMGKEGENLGDLLLEDFDADPPLASLQAFIADPQAQAGSLLGKTTTRIVHDLERYQRTGQPPFAATLARETHVHDPGGVQTRIQISFSYSDGFGREIQKKIQAEAGDAPQREVPVPLLGGDIRPGDLVRDGQGDLIQADTPRRWVGTGRTVFNNKGKPVRQYEPFFSATHLHEPESEMTDTGVSPVLFYDPVERVVATLHPNHTYEKVVFDPWRQTTWDVNDTLHPPVNPADPPFDPKDDTDVGQYLSRLPQDEYLPTWHDLRTDAAKALQEWPDTDSGGQPLPENASRRAAEKTAAEKAAAHNNTPTVAHLDALGRPFMTIVHNRYERNGGVIDEENATRVDLDVEGNQRSVRDAVKESLDQHGNVTIDELGRIVMQYDYDMLGNRIHQASMEAGERWMLNDVAGNPVRAWDSRGHTFQNEYDSLRRPVRSFVTGADPGDPGRKLLTERTVYGETRPNPEVNNLRGQVVQLFDQAGIVTTDDYDFKGNLFRGTRQIAAEYKAALDWASAVPLEAPAYTTTTTYDALNRPLTATSPDGSIYRPTFNEANLLDKVDVDLPGAAATTAFVTNIDYDAKGQRTRIDYGTRDGAGISTIYDYDPETFRLILLKTTRNAAGFDATDRPGEVQNLHYTYDPAGNITHIRDDAQQTVYFDNRRVEPNAEYTYDAVYRLIEATGREHLGQTNGNLNKSTPPDALNGFHTRLPHPGDGDAMGTYIERYVYDAVGNFLEMQHHSSDPTNPDWTRAYTYGETSQLEAGKKNNRLSNTTVNGSTEDYRYEDPAGRHGNITFMTHLPLMEWDYRDQLQATARQRTTNGNIPETTYYVYDAGGQRVRKVTERQAAAGDTPTRMKERIYLGGFEIYREYDANSAAPTLERETLHVMDDKQRIALVETQTIENGNDIIEPVPLQRYQFGNHLGSTSVELAENGALISYEEYHPYGTTAFQAGRSVAEVSVKRYRYTGKERDEESGFSYHGARYYAPWLGKWVSTDPLGLIDGPNRYQYARNNPASQTDPTGLATLGFGELVEQIPGGTARTQVGIKTGEGPGHGLPVTKIEFDFSESQAGKVTPNSTDAPASKDGVNSDTVPRSEANADSGIAADPSESPSLLEQVGEVFMESETGQFIVGVTMGSMAGALPFGFTLGIGGEISGASEEFPRAFRAGYGAGEATWGIVQIVGGIGGEVGGGAMVVAGAGATVTGVGAPVGVLGMAGGTATIGVSTAVIAEGAADVVTGIGVFMSALDDPKSSQGSNNAATSSPNRARAKVRRGQGPKGISRIDPPNTNVKGSQWEAHTGGRGSPALKQDGTWKHVPAGQDPPSLPNTAIEWLRNHGWNI